VATFVITNNGTGDMQTEYTYQIKDDQGAVVDSGTFQLDAGESQTIPVTGSSTFYTFTTLEDQTLTDEADMSLCVQVTATPTITLTPNAPDLSVSGSCTSNAGTASFVITNGGGDMTSPLTYTVTDENGNVVETGTIILAANGTTTISVTGTSDNYTFTITGNQSLTTVVDMTSCVEPTATPPVPTVAPAESQPCIQCLIFHTFRDDNLEVYRLDGIEGQDDFKLYNLSQDGAVDSRPSRAPDDSNVVFQSDRNGNVELYYTDMLGSGEANRLTNTNSNNTNAMYGPDARTIVYQSDRNGNLDLFTIDQVTGKETQITSDAADDANAFYSPDLKWLVFQSNRNGNWDIFALDTETGNEYQLTNTQADEVFPSWSPNGKQISFLIDNNGATDLYLMNTDGTNIKRITTDGKTNNTVWSPEGDRIAYQSERNGNLDVYSYDTRDGKEYRVTDYEGIDSGPTWDCGGDNLAFTSTRDGDTNIFQVYWQGGPAGNMTIDPATDKWSQWRPSNDVSSVGY
jgi:Tol biopolymer transport system component